MSTQVDPAVTQAAATQATPNGAPSDWRATLPEELRGEKSFEKFKGVGDVAKSYLELQKSMGNAIRIPKDDSKPEEWDAYYTKIGRPESPDKYTFTRGEVPEGITYDEKMETAFKGIAHKRGLLPAQAQGILDDYNALQVQRQAELKTTMQEGVAALKKEWGPEFDRNIDLGRQMVSKVGGDELKKFFDETGLGNHPVMVKMFAKLGAAGAEDRMVIGNEAAPDQSSVEAIQLKINAIRQDAKHPYNDSRAMPAAHEAAMKEMANLYQQLVVAQGGEKD